MKTKTSIPIPITQPLTFRPHVAVLTSEIDQSVNFVRNNGQESRFVRRVDDYFIAYLSSHNGCDKACRFCHLTQTKQTQMVPATAADFEQQLRFVTDHYKVTLERGAKPARRINLNWMARGEPLDNPLLQGSEWRNTSNYLVTRLMNNGLGGLEVKFNISTIFPKGLLNSKLPGKTDERTVIYYSLYSMRPEFRKRWLPKAQDPKIALDALAQWQYDTDQSVVLHWAFIEGENDSEEDAYQVIKAVQDSGLMAKMNVVRYNPFSPAQGKEPDERVIIARFNQLKASMWSQGSRIVPRVGLDVKASCGMFVNLKAEDHESESDY